MISEVIIHRTSVCLPDGSGHFSFSRDESAVTYGVWSLRILRRKDSLVYNLETYKVDSSTLSERQVIVL